MTWQAFETWLNASTRRTLVMGVLNVTPDSFSDGGRFADLRMAADHARQMVAEGADLIDIGGESTRPGAARVSSEEQIRRIIPVIGKLQRCRRDYFGRYDPRCRSRSRPRRRAHLVNDISGGAHDPAMLGLVARRSAPVVLMHMRGEPATMQHMTDYTDVVAEVRQSLIDRRAAAIAAGIEPIRIILDPGIGFAKTMLHNLTLMRNLRQLADLGSPLLLGVSRKGFIGKITGEDDPSHRLFGTAASISWCVANGAAIVRVHDVAQMVKVVRMTEAIQKGFST